MTNLFKLGEFNASSGTMQPWKIECDALTSDDWECIAAMLIEMIGPFGNVEGVPGGGLPFANALQRYKSEEGPLLIVDDVLTTGNNMEHLRDSIDKPSFGAVVFSRSPMTPTWITPIFRMWQ